MIAEPAFDAADDEKASHQDEEGEDDVAQGQADLADLDAAFTEASKAVAQDDTQAAAWAVGELKIPWCYGFFTNCQSPHGGHFYLAWTQGAHAADDKYRITISGVSGLCAAGFGTRTRDVPSAGNAGQSYDWAENSWPTWVCGPVPLVNWFPTTYRVQIQTLRADGTLSDPVGSTVTITTTRMP